MANRTALQISAPLFLQGDSSGRGLGWVDLDYAASVGSVTLGLVKYCPPPRLKWAKNANSHPDSRNPASHIPPLIMSVQLSDRFLLG